jgi:hypothetical protein
MKAALILGVLVTFAAASPSTAQRPIRPRQRLPAAGAPAQDRAVMERRIRETFYRVAKERVGLDDGQMRRLGGVNARYEPQRRALLRDENQTRRALRGELNSGKPDDAKVSAGLAKLQDIRRKRLEIDDQEQRDLAEFMTPTQQVKYRSLQEQLRRRLEQFRQEHRDNRLTDDSVPGEPLR